MHGEIYTGFLKTCGESDLRTLQAAHNYAGSLAQLQRLGEAKTIFRKTMPVARRVLGESHDLTLTMRANYAMALYDPSADPSATLDDLREAVTTLEEIEPTTRRVHGGTHPNAVKIMLRLRDARAALRAREGDVESLREAIEAMTPEDA